jgi:hypothetical protein
MHDLLRVVVAVRVRGTNASDTRRPTSGGRARAGAADATSGFVASAEGAKKRSAGSGGLESVVDFIVKQGLLTEAKPD